VKLRGLKEARKFIKMVVFEGDVESEDEDQEDNIADLDLESLKVDEGSGGGIQRVESFSSVEGVEESIGDVDILEEEANQFAYEYFLGKLGDLVTFLNNEYPDSETPMTEEIATCILSLACGELTHLETMDGLMD
jgi:hypothetical protein